MLKIKDTTGHTFFVSTDVEYNLINELKALGQRLEVAVRLHRGENYAKIVKDTGASSTTVSRVNRCLNYGAGGYQTVIPRITKGEENA